MSPSFSAWPPLRFESTASECATRSTKHRAPVRRAQVQGHAALVAVEGLEVHRVLPRLLRRHVAADVAAGAGVLDLDHVGAEIGELHRRPRPGAELLDGEDADVGERRDGSHCPGVTTWRVHIADVIAVPGSAAYFFDDQAAILAGAPRDGLNYPGTPLTPGFERSASPPRRSRSCSSSATARSRTATASASSTAASAAASRCSTGPRSPRELDDELAPLLRGRTVDRVRAAQGALRRAREGRGATASRRRCSTRARTGQALHDGAARPARVGPRHPARSPCRCSPRPARTAATASTR